MDNKITHKKINSKAQIHSQTEVQMQAQIQSQTKQHPEGLPTEHQKIHILEASDITANWGQNKVLDGVNLSASSGEFICLTGGNGCGKSTLLTVISGLAGDIFNNALKIDNCSKIMYDGKSIKDIGRKELARHIAYLTQTETSAWNYNARDIILTGRYPHIKTAGYYSSKDHDIVDDIIARLGIKKIADKQVYQLSGGEYQKIRIARCLAQQPEILLLDEPVANLDFGYQTELLSLLKDLCHNDKPIGILVVIHDINTAVQYADKMFLLPRLKDCIKGTVLETITMENLEETYPQNSFGIYTHPYFGCPQIFIKDNHR